MQIRRNLPRTDLVPGDNWAREDAVGENELAAEAIGVNVGVDDVEPFMEGLTALLPLQVKWLFRDRLVVDLLNERARPSFCGRVHLHERQESANPLFLVARWIERAG